MARKPSITRVSSCPPAIQAGNEGSEPTERQQNERYVPCPSADVKIPRSSLPSKQKLHVYRTGVESSATVNSEELVDSDSGSSDDSSTDDGGAEAMAMRSLAKHFSTSIHQSSVASVASVPPVAETQPEVLSVSFDADMCHHDEEDSEQLSECGSSSYIKLDTATSTTSEYTKGSQPSHRTEEQPEKSRAGSYVILSTAAQGSMPQDQAKGSNNLQSSLAVHSTVDDPLVPNLSLQSPAGDAVATRCSSSQTCSPNAEHQAPRNTEMSPYQEHPRIKETSHNFKDTGFVVAPCKSPDELLGSFSSGSIQKEMGSVALPDLLPEIEDDGSFEEGSSPLITDLQEESEVDFTDFRGVAELSLAQFSDPISNIDLELSKMSEQLSFVLEGENNPCNSRPRADKELNGAKVSTGNASNQDLHEHSRQEDSTLSEDSQMSLGKFSHPISNVGVDFSEMPEQPFSVLDKEHSHYSSQPPVDMELDSAKSGYLSNLELHEHNGQEDSTLPEDSHEVNSSPDLDPFKFCRNTSTNHTPSVTEEIYRLLPELMNNTADGEDSDEENEDDAVTSDTELTSLCGPVGYSPGNVEVLNTPFLMFDPGQENLEMKEFSLNNLSKENLKSTEFPVFNDDHFLSQEISSQCSNQLDDAESEDGCSLNGDQEAECGIQGNIWVDPGYKEMGDLKGKLR